MMFAALLKHELQVRLHQLSDLWLILVFTLLSALLFPIAIGPEPQLLVRIGPGIIWVLILFSAHLASQNAWREDLGDGTLEQLCHMHTPTEWIVLAKALGVWIHYFAGLLLFSPVLGLAFGMEANIIWVMVGTLLLASLPLALLTVTGGLITRSGILSALILLPLYLPLLIFSCSACEAAASGQAIELPLTILTGVGLLLCPLLIYVNMGILKWTNQ